MSISQKIEKIYKNQIEIIKNEKNSETKMKMIGALVLDLGDRSMNAVSKACNFSWRYVKKSYNFINGIYTSVIETRGRKLLTEKYPNLISDVTKIIEDYLLTDPHFRSEKQYVKLTIKQIKELLIETGKYNNNSFSNSYLNNLINKLGYSLKKVQKVKPLKKIAETDDIFENVHQKKEEAMQDSSTVLISIDTKDKVLIGPFSRKGKNRIEIQAVDHELTNNCIIPFGILDMKKNIPYFFNFTDKPTSLDLVDCVEEFYKEQYQNTNVKKIVILLDNGPDNSGVRTVFLKGLIEMSKKYNIEIELVYYPPYHSKYNPTERLWARLENIWSGFLLENTDICLNFMKNLTWKNEKSITKLKTKQYKKGLTVKREEMLELERNHIFRKENIKKWSLIITP